ncbi:MAG: MoaD/ThiS family protein [Candidatus Hodarchaeota archaeon]
MTTLSVSSPKVRKIIVEERKTVAELLRDLKISNDHVVLIDGKKASLTDIIEENMAIVILPLIAGG